MWQTVIFVTIREIYAVGGGSDGTPFRSFIKEPAPVEIESCLHIVCIQFAQAYSLYTVVKKHCCFQYFILLYCVSVSVFCCVFVPCRSAFADKNEHSQQAVVNWKPRCKLSSLALLTSLSVNSEAATTSICISGEQQYNILKIWLNFIVGLIKLCVVCSC